MRLALSKQTKAMLYRRCLALRKANEQIAADNQRLRVKLYGITDDSIPHILDRDMRQGQTVCVRVPKRFLVRNDDEYFGRRRVR